MRAGAVGAVLLVVAVVAMETSGRRRSTQAPEPQTSAPIQTQAPRVEQPAAPSIAQATPALAPALTVSPIPPLPVNATSVPDEYFLKLAAMVDLAGAKDHRPDKKHWEQALAIAQNLSGGPCDCEQRNWLNHFMEMGNYALSDADQDYYQSAQLMATLGRNDHDAMAISQRPN